MKKNDFTSEDLRTALRVIEVSPATGISQLTIEIQNRLRQQDKIDAQDSALRRDIHDHLVLNKDNPTDTQLWDSATNIVRHIRATGWQKPNEPEVHENA